MTTKPKRDLTRETEWLLRDKYNGRRSAAADRDIAKLKQGEHINYLIGWAPFLDCRIDLSAKPLIPRPETEHWTKEILDEIKKSKSPKPKILDLFCGSGCIGVAALKHAPEALVDFSDIENKYFTGIKKSLRANKIDSKRAKYVRSDVLKNIGSKKYDYILANPPYIPTTGRAVAKSVLSQEPKRALFAGKDGLQYIRRLLREGKDYLNPNGTIVIEFDPPQKKAILEYAKNKGWEAEFFKDQYGRWRFSKLRNKKAVQ